MGKMIVRSVARRTTIKTRKGATLNSLYSKSILNELKRRAAAKKKAREEKE